MLLRRIDALVERLREAERQTPRERGGVAGHDDIEGRLAEARREYEMLMHNSARVDTSALRLIGAATASRREVQAALLTGELLVEYLMTSEQLVVFALTRETSRVLRVPVGAADMESRIRLARDLAGQRRDAPATRRAALEWLHGSLIAPLEDGAPAVVRRLIIVPHGALAYLPFAALINAKSGRALVQEVTLQMVPSAAALTAVRHSGGAAAMPGLTVLAPFPRELPGSKEEMRAIARRPRVTTVEALRATEAAARAALSSGAMVHFATHGILNVRNPMFSRLELARAAMVHPGDDGRLEVHELLAFEVRSPMVFLSGCETGVGGEWSTAFRRGEDYATLAQAFLLAGARNVIATLWRIEDRGAAEFATAFYNALPASDPAEALAIAQRAMLSSERYSAPYYWAGYTLSGSGTPVAQKRQALAVQ
jgi:CHAT domain-containing protein